MNVLHLGRHRRPAPVDPHVCHCIIRHPVTAAERERITAEWVRAVLTHDTNRADHLRIRLTTHCPPAQVMRPCGCGRPLREHVEMKAAA